MRTRPTISFTIDKAVNDSLEKEMVNKSKVIDHVLSLFFTTGAPIPKKFLKK